MHFFQRNRLKQLLNSLFFDMQEPMGYFYCSFPHADLTPKIMSVMTFLKCFKPEEI